MLDVYGSDEIKATLLLLRDMQRDLRREFYKAARSRIVPEWRQELAASATTHLEERVIVAGARANVTDRGVRLVAAQSTKKMSGGASPKEIGHAIEFGAKWRRGVIESTSTLGNPFSYQRVLNKQLKPRRSVGYLAWPAAARMAPRFASLWVQLAVKKAYDAFERKS
jgi:hypothetical protein